MITTGLREAESGSLNERTNKAEAKDIPKERFMFLDALFSIILILLFLINYHSFLDLNVHQQYIANSKTREENISNINQVSYHQINNNNIRKDSNPIQNIDNNQDINRQQNDHYEKNQNRDRKFNNPPNDNRDFDNKRNDNRKYDNERNENERNDRRFNDERNDRRFNDERNDRRFNDERNDRRFNDERNDRKFNDERNDRRFNDERNDRRFNDERNDRKFNDERSIDRDFGDERSRKEEFFNRDHKNRVRRDRDHYRRNFDRHSNFNRDGHDRQSSGWHSDSRGNHTFDSGLSMREVLMKSHLAGQDFSIMMKILEIDIREPFYPADSSCQVPELLNYTEQMCEAAGSAFTCERRARLREPRMAHIMNFAFEVDVLEIHLDELYPVVDKIFLCECAYIHGRSGLRKPCVWDMIKDQERLRKFSDKVVLIWISESEIRETLLRLNEWHVEYKMEELRWKKFLEWNKVNNYFDDDDVIASIYNLNLIKHCETKTFLDVGIWFTRGRITEKVKTDWPVKKEPFALGDTSFFTLSQAKIYPKNAPKCHSPCNYPGRTRGFAPNFVLGGLHLSSYKYIPQYMLKLMSMTETRQTEYDELNRIMQMVKKGENFQNIQRDIALKKFSHPLGGDLLNMNQNDIGTKQYILPWFLKCNQKRYSTFFLNIIDDPRLD